MDPIFLAGAVVILLISIIIHEVMHGLAALYYGDTTARDAGRLTLNPIPHIDPIGSLLLPALMFWVNGPILGWAKPVPVNPLRFRDIKTGEIVVSLAGIAANLAIALIAVILFHLLAPSLGLGDVVISLIRFTYTINLVLALFNLIPIPPLDGSKVLMALLPYHLAREYEKLSQYGFFILILLLYIPLYKGASILSVYITYSILLVSDLFNIIPKSF